MIAICLALIDDEDDRHVFERLYRKLNKTVYFTALRITDTKEDAEDAAQNVWLYTAKNLGRIQKLQEHKLDPYFITMSKHAAFNILKKYKIKTVDLDKNFISELSYNMDLPHNDHEDKLALYILTLPETYRQVLELKYIFGLKNREIADHLDMKQSSVESRILRGRNLLIQKIKEEGIL